MYLDAFSGSHHYILDYLVDEVLNRQPETIRSFLLQTSILERMTGTLCDALTEQNDGQAVLEALVRANLFVTALDEERNWYRYHHLFADVLRNRLQQAGRETGAPPQIHELHQRAATWFAGAMALLPRRTSP